MTVRTLLGLSLLVNIALISFIATQHFSNNVRTEKNKNSGYERELRPHADGRLRGLPRELRGLSNLESLTPEQRDGVRAIIEKHLPDVREKGRLAREASRAFRQTLRDPDYDAQTARIRALAMTTARRDHQEVATLLLLDAMAILPPEARQTLLARKGARRDHKHDKRNKKRGGGDDHQ